jgi:molybdenum cofactor biosynthesis protein B
MMAGARGAAARRRAHPHAGHAGIVRCAIVTVSDTRGAADDRSGATLQRSLERGGHLVALRLWVRDDAPAIRRAAAAALRQRDVDAVVLTGGTGIAPRDVTPEAVAPLVARWLPGFGELFRMLSYREVGAAAWLSRAGAGVARGKLLIILPGSPAAVRLAADRLLVPELGHALGLLRTPGRKR